MDIPSAGIGEGALTALRWTPRQKALALGSPALLALLACGAWHLGQKVADAARDALRLKIRF